MKHLSTLFILSLLSTFSLSGQNLLFERAIMVTDTITEVDDEEGERTFAASSDDAEQENDEIDTLWDDDIDTGWEGAPEDQNILTAGLRFRDIHVPEGAIIDSAFFVLTSHEAKAADDVARITIYAEDVDSASTFTEDALITDRTPTEAQVVWEVAEAWGLWTTHQSIDIGPIVQEIVDREGWKAGNAIAFILAGENQGPSEVENAREFEAFENIADPEDGGDGQNHPERVPRLQIYYRTTTQSARLEMPIMVTDTITEVDDEEGERTFAASSDDAEQENDEIDTLWDDDIDTGWEGAPEDQNILTAGLRFRDLAIPAGAQIDSAFFVLTSHEAKAADDVARITIYAEDVDSASTFTEDALITDRTPTEAQVIWEVAEAWGLWTTHQSIDIGPIVQEIVDREGWKAGNAIAFILAGEDQGPSEVENAREFEAFENIADPEDGGDGQNHPERVPRLVVYFSSEGSSSVFSPGKDYQTLTVYPNPSANGQVLVELAQDAPAQLELFNLNGQLVRALRSDFGLQVTFPTHNLAPGTYLLRARQGRDLYIQKVILK